MNKPSRLGKYLLLEQIHLGTLAEVFIARADGIAGAEPLVALKRLLPSVTQDPGLVSLFVDEAKIATQLSHGNIAHVLDVGRQEDTYFISMEYVSGRSLQALLAHTAIRGKPMPIAQAAFLASELCQGLDYAHRRKDLQGRDLGIVHRGVSPGNVLLSYDGAVKLIDFGMAKAASSSHHTVAGAFRGKIGYMSPEQIRGQVLDRRSDVFSIGLVLYEMLTGAKAFNASSDVEAMRQVSDADVRPPRSLNPKLPEALEAVVVKALARERKDRYQWASELREALLPFTFAGGSVFSTQQLADEMTRLFADQSRKEANRLRELAAYREPSPKRPERGGAPTQPMRAASAAVEADPYGFGEDGEEDGATQLVSSPFDPGLPERPSLRAVPKPKPVPTPDQVTPEMMSAVTRQIPLPKEEETRPSGRPLGTTQPRLKPIEPELELESPPTDPPEPEEDEAPPPAAPRLSPPPPSPPQPTSAGVPGWVWAVVAIAVLAVAGAVVYALRPRAPAYSTVTVRVVPPEHALVTVAGRLVENGRPLQLPPGQYDLVASAPGFKQHIQKIVVLAHAPNLFTVLLEPEPSQQQTQPDHPQTPEQAAKTFTARFVSLEPGVEVVIDGKSIGRTPHAEVTLPVGSAYLYTAQEDGYEKAHGIFGSSGEPVVTVTVALKKKGSGRHHRHTATGALVCSTQPPGASVIVDGNSTGAQTPVFPDDPLILPVGTHQVVFLSGDTKTAPRTVVIEKGKVAVLKDIQIAQGQPPSGQDPEPPQELKKDGAAGGGTQPASDPKKDTSSGDPDMPEPMTQ